MSRLSVLEAAIDAAITNATVDGSITAAIEGAQLKAVAEFANLASSSVYRAKLRQTGTGAPTAVVLENNTGLTITYSRTDVGTYRATPSSNPGENKAIVFIGHGATKCFTEASWYGTGKIEIQTYTVDVDGAPAMADDLLYDTDIEFRVYP